MFHIDLGFDIFWIWLNFTGVIITLVVAYVVSAFTKNIKVKRLKKIDFSLKKSDFFIKEVYILGTFFIAILVFSYFVPSIFG